MRRLRMFCQRGHNEFYISGGGLLFVVLTWALWHAHK